jgi:hypothetical protein
MGIGLALALGYYVWNKNKSSAASSPASTSTENGSTEPADQVPPYIIQNYSTDVNAQTVGPTTTSINPTAPPTPPPVPPTIPPPTKTRPTSIVAPGTDSGDINRIAQQYGLTEAQLVAANPSLRKMKVTVGGKSINLIGSGAPVPKGTKLTIPAVPKK